MLYVKVMSLARSNRVFFHPCGIEILKCYEFILDCMKVNNIRTMNW